MLIYSDIYENDFLIKAEKHHYKMKINGWYCGGFSAASDTEALAIFKNILKGEKN